jgi:hypothetical protein
MSLSKALVGVLTCFLAIGCEKVVDSTTTSVAATAYRAALIDSALHYIDVRERPDSAIQILGKLKPLCEPYPELRVRYNAILLELAWKTGNYEDVITASISSLYQAMLKGQIRDEGNAQLSNIVGHALRKSGDTAAAIRYYQFMASNELLTTRKDAQANLLRMFSKTGNHDKAIQLAVQVEPKELMHNSDVSAHLNREFYWGRSLFLTGKKDLGIQHIRRVLMYLTAPRSNYNTTELRVRLSTTRGILADDLIPVLPNAIQLSLRSAILSSISSDSAYLRRHFNVREQYAGKMQTKIPEHLFIHPPNTIPMFSKSVVENTAINQTVRDAYSVRWHATLLGLFIEAGQHFVRVDLPELHGVVRPIRNVRINNDSLYVTTYSGNLKPLPIDSLLANYTRFKPNSDFVTSTPSLSSLVATATKDTLFVDDTTLLIGTASGLTLHNSRTSRDQFIPNPNGIQDVLLALYRNGDSIIMSSRALGMRVIEKDQLIAGARDFIQFEPLKLLQLMKLSPQIATVAERQILGEYPPQSIALYDGLFPNTVQRVYMLEHKYVVVVRSNSIMAASASSNKLQLYEWPDSLASSFEQGFHTSLKNDSILEIRSSIHRVTVNIKRLLARPLPGCLVAWIGHKDAHAQLAWLRNESIPLECSDSLTCVVGTSGLLSNYLTTVGVAQSWRADTPCYAASSIHRIDLPNTRECSLQYSVPGIVQPSTLVLRPDIHPLLYQDVLVALLIVGSCGSAIGIIHVWQRNAVRRRQDLEHQHSSIARDLHDTLGADLARLTALLNAHEIQGSREIVNAALAANRKFRSLLWIWRSDSIRLSDFTGELREYLHASLTDAQIELRTTTTALPDNSFVDAAVAKSVLLIINESLSNIIRHASSTAVTLDFICEQTSFTLRLIDNGIGFDVQNVRRKGGIQNIQDRASENGFHADIISTEGAGTTVLISFGVHIS